jgi:uroporphyrinogen-III synthase
MTIDAHGGDRGASGSSPSPLSTINDKGILLTRAEEDCREWARRLALLGARTVILPCITTELIETRELRTAARRAAGQSDWLVFTSRRGVHAFAELSDGTRVPEATHIAVVGRATAGAAQAMFGRVDVIGGEDTDAAPGARYSSRADLDATPANGPQPGTAEALARTLERALEAEHPKVTLALAENAADVGERALTAAGARCTRLDVYRTVPAPPRHPREALSALGADNVFLASPSAVTGLVNQVEIDVPAALYAIGPSTAARIRELGLAVAGEAREPSLEGLLEILQCRN